MGKCATYGVHRGLVGAVYDELDSGGGDGVMGIEPELERKLLALRSHMSIGRVGVPQGVGVARVWATHLVDRVPKHFYREIPCGEVVRAQQLNP